jgi:hypothetical protein
MARYRHIDMSSQLLPVDLQAQLVPGSFAHAVHHLVDQLDLSAFDAHYRNDPAPTWGICIPCSTLAEAPSSVGIPANHQGLVRLSRLAAQADAGMHISRNEVCMSCCSENADMHADAGKSRRLLGEVWRVLRVSHYSLGSRGVPCSLAGRTTRVRRRGCQTTACMLWTVVRRGGADPRATCAGGANQPCSSAAPYPAASTEAAAA